MERLGFNAAKLAPSQGDKLRPREQKLSRALRLFHGALEWFSYKLFSTVLADDDILSLIF